MSNTNTITDGTKTINTQTPQPLMVGVIAGAHGIRGLVKIKPFTQSPQSLGDYTVFDANNTVYNLNVKGENKGNILAQIEGVNDRTQAETLRGIELFINRNDMPELDSDDEFYHADLIGLDVRLDTDNSPYGKIRAIYDFGSGDVLDIARPDGTSEMHPFTLDVCPTVNVSEGFVTLAPLPTTDGDTQTRQGIEQ